MWMHHNEPASKHQIMEWKHIIAEGKDIQRLAFCWQSDTDAVLGLYGAHLQALSGLWTDLQ
jgi:hypothetical protein